MASDPANPWKLCRVPSILYQAQTTTMEDLTPFNGCINLDPGTRKLMMDMIRSMKSLIPDEPPPKDSSGYADSPFIKEFVKQIVKASLNHEGLLSGIVDTDSLEKLRRNANNLQEVCDQVERLLKALRRQQNLAAYQSYKQAALIKEHLELIVPEALKDANQINEKIRTKKNHSTCKEKNIKLKVV